LQPGEAAAPLPAPRVSRPSSVLWSPPTPCSTAGLRFRVPFSAPLPGRTIGPRSTRGSPVRSSGGLRGRAPWTPSRRNEACSVSAPRGVASFASRRQARPGNNPHCPGSSLAGGDDATTAFTWVPAREFVAPGMRVMALSFRFSVIPSAIPEGIRLSGERTIPRTDPLQAVNRLKPLGRTPRIIPQAGGRDGHSHFGKLPPVYGGGLRGVVRKSWL
jgi:hypothetical protein